MPGPLIGFVGAKMNAAQSSRLMKERDLYELQMNTVEEAMCDMLWDCTGGSDCICPGWSGSYKVQVTLGEELLRQGWRRDIADLSRGRDIKDR